jgi:hypothetical protein
MRDVRWFHGEGESDQVDNKSGPEPDRQEQRSSLAFQPMTALLPIMGVSPPFEKPMPIQPEEGNKFRQLSTPQQEEASGKQCQATRTQQRGSIAAEPAHLHCS